MPAIRTITAFLDGPDSPDISNPIHSTGVAQQFGFKAALVGGVTVYGWCAPAIIDLLGERWLEDGWADVSFRRPVYPGDEMTATVFDDGRLEMANADGGVCIRGMVGLGKADFAAGLHVPGQTAAAPPADPKPELTLESAKTGEDMRAMWVPFTADDARGYAIDLQKDGRELWTGPASRYHPGWLAARMTPLIKHSYWYGPSIHARSQVQHVGPALAGEGVTVSGHFVRAYEDNGHHYAEVDGMILGGGGNAVAQIRHTTIFRPRMANG